MPFNGSVPGSAPGTAEIMEYVTSLRRYARALTGSQGTGDRFAAATLEAVLADPSALDSDHDPKVALFRSLHLVWTSAGAPVGEPDTALSARAQERMAGLTPSSREALLLHAGEGFDFAEVGRVLGLSEWAARELVDTGRREMEAAMRGKVLIIEDETIIALDLAGIVEDLGHRVTGVAQTADAAIDLAARERPDLVLADIQLADNSSGIDAVNEILRQFDELPVVFITAFPERYLTGERPEPAFLIAKPFSEEQVRSAVSQAIFFSSTESLVA
jgi:CheY-like chemotaxis protein